MKASANIQNVKRQDKAMYRCLINSRRHMSDETIFSSMQIIKFLEYELKNLHMILTRMVIVVPMDLF